MAMPPETFRYVNQASRFGPTRPIARVDSNKKRTYHEYIQIKEAEMHAIAAYALRDITEIAALGAFLIMIAFIARAIGS
jgi:hypothetical protein